MSRNRGSRQSPMRERKPSPSFAARILQGKGVKDESLDLFSWLRKSTSSVPASNDNVKSQTVLKLRSPNGTQAAQAKFSGGVQGKMKRLANGKVQTDDILFPEVGKTEFNWLMTPPGSPSHRNNQQPSSIFQKEKEITPKVKARSISASRPSRLSQEINNSTMPTKMARSSSVARASVSSKSTTTNSVLSHVRRSSLPNPIHRTSSLGTHSTNRSSSNAAKPLLPSSSATSNSKLPSSLSTRPGASWLPSPAKTRNPRTNQTPYPERPNSSSNTAHVPRTTTSPRPLTPQRRAISSAPQSSNTVHRSNSLSRLPSQEAESLKTSKPLEMSLSTVKQQVLRARPSASMNQRPATSPVTTPRRNTARSRFGENLGKSRLGSMSQGTKTGPLTDTKTLRTSFKQVPAIDQKIISQTRSSKSIEVNAKQIDTRQGGGGPRRAPIYPRSNSSRLPATRNRTEDEPRSSGKIVPTDDTTLSDRAVSEEGPVRPLSDIFESTRYDFLLKEDARNLTWLRGDDEMSLRCPSFHRFDLPPEPFGE